VSTNLDTTRPELDSKRSKTPSEGDGGTKDGGTVKWKGSVARMVQMVFFLALVDHPSPVAQQARAVYVAISPFPSTLFLSSGCS
jgi:hypothetical protein